jgi:hypothetical protein
MFSIKFPTNFTQNLVHSATFKLRDGVSRTTVKGETAFFILQSIGPPVFEEIANQSVIDLTGYTGADLSLGVGQESVYTISAVTSLALRIACLTDQLYSLDCIFDLVAGAAIGTTNYLQVNNANLGTNIVEYQSVFGAGAGASAAPSDTNVYGLDAGNVASRVHAEISTRTQSKSCISTFTALTAGAGAQTGVVGNTWNDTSTAHTSIGTLQFNRSSSGKVILKRLL